MYLEDDAIPILEALIGSAGVIALLLHFSWIIESHFGLCFAFPLGEIECCPLHPIPRSLQLSPQLVVIRDELAATKLRSVPLSEFPFMAQDGSLYQCGLQHIALDNNLSYCDVQLQL